MYKEEIYKKIQLLKEQGRLYTNCYSEGKIKLADRIWETQNAFLFSYNDHGTDRLIYFFTKREALKELLQCPNDREYVIEFMTRDADENKNLFLDAGFNVLAKMKRMANTDCRNVFDNSSVMVYYDDQVGMLAKLEESAEINKILWTIFDNRISHLLTNEEIEEAIKRKEINIHRNNNGVIDAILQVSVFPHKFYINQVYNSTDRSVIHAILLKRLHEYCSINGKYIYAWVEQNNIASIKFHQKYGMKHDGMWDIIYISGKRNGIN